MSLPFRVRLHFERRRLDAEERVLAYLADVDHWADGLEISRATGLRFGRLYPTLDRLKSTSMVVDRWEPLEPGKKYRRRLYAIVAEAKP